MTDRDLAEELMALLKTTEVTNARDFSLDTRFRLTRLADYLGPDWTQALYHAAVFMTRVV